MVTSMLYKMRPARLKARRRLERELIRAEADRLSGRQAGRMEPGEWIVQYMKMLGEVKDSLNYTGEDEPLATWYGWNEFHEYCMRTYRSGNAPWPESEPKLLVIGGRGECARLHMAMVYKLANPGFRMTESDSGERPGNVAEARELFGDLSMHMGLDERLVYAWKEMTVEELCTSTIRNSSMYAETLTSSAVTSPYEVPLSSYPPPTFQTVGNVEIPGFTIPEFTAEYNHYEWLERDLEELARTRDRDEWVSQLTVPNRANTASTSGMSNTASADSANAVDDCGDGAPF